MLGPRREGPNTAQSGTRARQIVNDAADLLGVAIVRIVRVEISMGQIATEQASLPDPTPISHMIERGRQRVLVIGSAFKGRALLTFFAVREAAKMDNPTRRDRVAPSASEMLLLLVCWLIYTAMILFR